MISFKEPSEYPHFMTYADLHKALNTLRGIVAGISSDSDTSAVEFEELVNWCTLHSHFSGMHPFNELLPMIDEAFQDGVFSEEEKKDILWLCNNFTSNTEFYDDISSTLQYLMGLLHGLLADNEITNDEIASLRSWIEDHDFLKGRYPYDEIDSLLLAVLEDHKIDDAERAMLKAFFSSFVDTKTSLNLSEVELTDLRKKHHINGICVACPEIHFDGSVFCFTGTSRKAKRNDIAAIIDQQGGKYIDRVSGKTNYLIVGSGGNPSWAYSCYGRKVEEAVALRKEGQQILIIHESDFWDALE